MSRSFVPWSLFSWTGDGEGDGSVYGWRGFAGGACLEAGEVARSVRLPEEQWRCVGLGETEGDVLNGGRDVILGENEGLVVLKRV